MDFLKLICKKTLLSILTKRINGLIEDWGEVLKFDIDSTERTLHTEVLLKGEEKPISVSINGYSIEESDGSIFVVVENISTSREWLSVLLNKYSVNKEFRVPDKYKRWIKLLLIK